MEKSIFRSWKSAYFHGDILNAPSVYDDQELERIKKSGHSAIWATGILRNISRSDIFPEWNKDINRKNSEALNILTERAKKHGLEVFIYLVEPRCLSESDPFWKEHPELKGTYGKSAMIEYEKGYALCTSQPVVLDFLENATKNLFKDTPKLKGLKLVTASEHLHHCLCFSTPVWDLYKTQYPNLCPICRDRDPVGLVSEIVNRIAKGAFSTRPDAEIIASVWGWKWYENVPHPRLIDSLHKKVALQIEFEIGGTKDEEDGSRRRIGEYSLSYLGPSETCVQYARFLKDKKRNFYIKLVLGTTHELAVVPCIPVPTRIYEKVLSAKEMEPTGYLCFTFGIIPCLNLKVQEKLLAASSIPDDKNEFMKELALEYFPGCNPEMVCKAWRFFAMAIDLYPFSNRFLYYGPVNCSLAYKQYPGPVQGKPMRETWLALPRDGDDLSSCIPDDSEEIIIERFEEMTRRFRKGLTYYRPGLKNVKTKTEEIGYAEIIPLVFASVANIFKIHLLKKTWQSSRMKSFKKILREELTICRKALPLVKLDKRLGFHIEAQTYMFSEKLIQEKIKHIQSILKRN